VSRHRILLGDALSAIIDHRGKTPKKLGGEWTSTGHRVVSAINIKDSRVDDNDHHYVDDELYAKWMKLPLKAGDVLLTSEAPTGEVAYLANDTDWCLGQRLFALRGTPGLLDGRYLFYLLRGGDVRHQLLARATGTTVSGIRQAELVQVELELPPIEEQSSVAATLGALDSKIESNRRAIALMEELARAHFDRLFDTDLYDAGVSLSTLIKVNPRRALAGGELATYLGMASLPEFSAEIYEWETKPAGSGQRFINGDVLMARITPCLENGKTAVVDMLEPDEVAWGSTEYIVLTPRGEITTPWIYCLVRNEAVRSFAIRSMTGTSGRQRFQAERFDQYKITPPESAALKEFNSIAEPMFARMTQLRDENRRAATLREILLPELLSGRIRTPEAEETVAEAIA
jgi:type I restriction enzyme, S subunit